MQWRKTKMILWYCCFFWVFNYAFGQAITLNLAGTGSTAYQGRVEITKNGITGTVCRDKFDNNAASVVCRQIGYRIGGTAVTDINRFGSGTGPIWLDDVVCLGNELAIQQCMSRQWNDSNCSHKEDVGVICHVQSSSKKAVVPFVTITNVPGIIQKSNCTVPPSTIRLIGPANLTGVGYVEVYRNGVWGAVCDDFWGTEDARVVCRMLCYDPSVAQAGYCPHYVKSTRQNVSTRFWLDDVECRGNETDIDQCPQAPLELQNCNPNADEYASVTCIKIPRKPPEDPQPILECSNGNFYLRFNRTEHPDLEERHLSVYNPFSGMCNPQKQTTTDYISISIDFDECGTGTMENATHLFYNNSIKYDYTQIDVNIARVNTYRINITCCFPRAVNESGGYTPPPDGIALKEEGKLSIVMIFYNDSFSTALTPPIVYRVGTLLNVALILQPAANDLKLIVSDCRATPSNNRNDPVYHDLFVDKCERDPTVGFFSLNATSFGFCFKTFTFINFRYVIIHCTAWVCRKSEKNDDCDRSCRNPSFGRGKREAPDRDIYRLVSSPVILTSEGDQSKDGATSIKLDFESTFRTSPSATLYSPSSSAAITTLQLEQPSITSFAKSSVTRADIKETEKQMLISSERKGLAAMQPSDNEGFTVATEQTEKLLDKNKLYFGGLGGKLNILSKAPITTCPIFLQICVSVIFILILDIYIL